MSKKILDTLNRVIKKVNELSDNTVFDMDHYDRCVIGRTIGWPCKSMWQDESQIIALKKLFDIKRVKIIGFPFDGTNLDNNGSPIFIDRHWKVIRLFTVAIGEEVTKKDWLKLATNVLNDLSSK